MVKAKFFALLFCLAFAATCNAKNEKSDCAADDADVRVNIAHYTNLSLPDHTNLSSVELSVTYAWEVEGEGYDGFMYCFFDRDEDTLDDDAYYDEKDIPKFCESMRGMRMWVTDVRGEYVQCTFPCDPARLKNCSDANICERTVEVAKPCPMGMMRTLMKNQTNITFTIDFGRAYDFNIFPYRGRHVLGSGDTHSHDAYLFCGHHLIHKHPVDEKAAYDFCRSEQVLSNLTTSSGPPINFTVAKTYRNQSDHTLTVVLQWEAPHRADRKREPDEYRVRMRTAEGDYAPVDVIPKAGQVVFSHVYHRMRPNKNYRFMVAAYMNLDKYCVHDEWCQNYGTYAVLDVIFEDWDPCTLNDATAERRCHERASCTKLNEGARAANCTCDAGYTGDGLEQSLGGTGCEDFDACQEGQKNCATAAECHDRPPPDTGYDCQCPDGYSGSGYTYCVSVTTALLASAGTICFVGASLLAYCVVRRRKKRIRRRLIYDQSRFVAGDSSPSLAPFLSYTQFENHLRTSTGPVFGDRWEVDRSTLTLGEVLGRGNFGVVHKATWNDKGEEKVVAVKSLTALYAASFREDFLAEMALLMSLGSHEAILGMVGVCTAQMDPDIDCASPLLVTEYMRHGDLLHFLWDCRESTKRSQDPIYNFSEGHLYKIGRQIAGGLLFLSSAKIIHGDVAARNILIGENLQCKISDFGLANDVYRYGMIKGATERRVPLKWVSPERMMGGKVPITWRSDVWSFGILLYEMVTVGATPYPSIEHSMLFSRLETGYRMPRPSTCNEELYKLMLQCWQWSPMCRPNFAALQGQLSNAESGQWEGGRSANQQILPVEELDRTSYDQQLTVRPIVNGHHSGLYPQLDSEEQQVGGDLLVSFEGILV